MFAVSCSKYGFSTSLPASKKEDQREPIFKELESILRKGGGWYPSKEPASPERTQDQQVHSVVRSIMGSLKTLGLLPSKSMGVPSLQKPVDRHRLSGFLYNISMYLQEMGAELEERQLVSDEEQLWGKVL